MLDILEKKKIIVYNINQKLKFVYYFSVNKRKFFIVKEYIL